MTRVNLVPVWELSDQHLIAEYHELPRALKQNINTDNAPARYVLGPGHVKWAKKHSLFLHARYLYLCNEMEYRGFNVKYPWQNIVDEYPVRESDDNYYIPTLVDMFRSKQRIREKYEMNPSYYTWTKRAKPRWLTNKYISIIGGTNDQG